MTAAPKHDRMSVQDYLASERHSSVKREYLGGVVYAMVGATNAHNLIAANVIGSLFGQLRGRPCKAYAPDTKIRVRTSSSTRFYYSDGVVVCDSNEPNQAYQDEPVIIVEVLSRSTRRIDFGEKKDAYQTIPSLRVYILLEQEFARAEVYRRRDEEFVREVYDGQDAVIPLPEIQASLSLSDAYDAIKFTPESDD